MASNVILILGAWVGTGRVGTLILSSSSSMLNAQMKQQRVSQEVVQMFHHSPLYICQHYPFFHFISILCLLKLLQPSYVHLSNSFCFPIAPEIIIYFCFPFPSSGFSSNSFLNTICYLHSLLHTFIIIAPFIS